ncbi:hypothetical protein HED60_01800 [Planctomycetales bacterium ZRK34]|nr:hypothetical protein HED60_01800 [Planctomycetales bacterium ZRK34]
MSGSPNPNAWNNWYHGVGSTHGSWLRGDPRGYRTHHHRFHVEGDYRNPPPPGVYAPIFEYTHSKLRHPPIKLSPRQRHMVCHAMIDRLHEDHVEVVALAIAVNHFHLLARFPLLESIARKRYARSLIRDGRDPAPRHYLGLARKHASHKLRDAKLKPEGPLWGVRPKFDPVRDRPHQLNVAHYIENHVREGAAVFHLRHGFIHA